MANWFDRYSGLDLVVGRPYEAHRVLEDRLGIPRGQAMRPVGYGVGFDVAHLQMNEDLSLSASCIQLMGIRPQSDDEPHNETGRDLRQMLLAYITSQRLDRPVLAHVQALSTPTQEDISTISELLKSRGVPHILRLRNIYIGLVEDGGRIYYDPDADAGTLLEFAPTVQVDFPGFIVPPRLENDPEVAELAPGTLVRPTARTQIVTSADAVIDRFQAMLDWPEEGDIEIVETSGQRSVIIKPINQLSAVWEFVEPKRKDSRAGQALLGYGAGPWTNRLGVFGLDEKLAELDDLGVRWTEIDRGSSGAKRVELNRLDVHGMGFELEDMPIVYRGSGAYRVP